MSSNSRRLYLLGDKTLSVIAKGLNGLLAAHGLPWEVVDLGYDTWLREIMDHSSRACREGDAALGFLLSPRILERPHAGRGDMARLLDRLSELAPARTVLCSNVFADPLRVQPLTQHRELTRAVAQINEDLYAFSEVNSWFHIVDHLGIATREGLRHIADPRYEAAAQMYFSPAGGRLVAQGWLRVLRALSRPSAKVLVVDLDNTLWRGILGEDGLNGLEMGPAGAGWPYHSLQKALLQLKSNGILLAACSKNNPEDALKALAEHPDCLLRPEDFAALEIGWEPKSQGIRKLATRLRLGIDSFVFLDDSAFERAEVRRALPEVTVIEFPDDPALLVTSLCDCPAFDSLRVTLEDRERSASYAAEARRDELQRVATSPEEFFRSLNMKLTLFRADTAQFERLHQLILKTNQFNLTTERLTPDEFRGMLDCQEKLVIGMRVADTLGDSGVVGLAIVNGVGSKSLTVSTFLLSCRVIGRTVENAFLSWLLSRADATGATEVHLKFHPTARNDVALEFLKRSGLRSSEDGLTWSTPVPPSSPGFAVHFVKIDDQVV
ncbi:MAG TPA: HAD-IIIC family phosphatase [Steroidobacteraceae bacterium]|nr:HAD-IIIC family phosphatase [Steroidobacteraceae bacterium]